MAETAQRLHDIIKYICQIHEIPTYSYSLISVTKDFIYLELTFCDKPFYLFKIEKPIGYDLEYDSGAVSEDGLISFEHNYEYPNQQTSYIGIGVQADYH